MTLRIWTRPAGAKITYGRKTLGETPITLTFNGPSTPMDLVIRKTGFMAVRTRVHRDKTRKYAFKLTPAKLH